MTSNPLAFVAVLVAAVLSSGAAAEIDCTQVEVSTLNESVESDNTYLYAASRVDSRPDRKAKDAFKALNMRMMRYWLTGTGYRQIRVETDGAQTLTTKCDQFEYYVLYVPVKSVKIFEEKPEAGSDKVSNQRIAEQFFLEAPK